MFIKNDTERKYVNGSIGIITDLEKDAIQVSVMDDDGQIKEAYSISAGLDYPSVGPEHAYLCETGRAQYVGIKDNEAMEALLYLTKLEGIVPAIESAHAVAYARKYAKTLTKDDIVIVNISGRGDKDMDTVIKYLEDRK